MEAHIIKVAVDKQFLLNDVSSENQLFSLNAFAPLFQKIKVKYITTFTNQTEHLRIKSTLSSTLSQEEKYLQLLFRKYNIENGSEILNKILTNAFTKYDITNFPEFIISKNKEFDSLKKYGIQIINDDAGNSFDKVALWRLKINEFFAKPNKKPHCKIRIEDRYLIKNIGDEEKAKTLFKTLNIEETPSDIEIIYSGRDYDYIGKSEQDYIDKLERQKRIDLIAEVGNKHNIRFIANAGHDRYLCTNNALYITGNSITSDKETHITYYPLLDYYGQYFKSE